VLSAAATRAAAARAVAYDAVRLFPGLIAESSSIVVIVAALPGAGCSLMPSRPLPSRQFAATNRYRARSYHVARAHRPARSGAQTMLLGAVCGAAMFGSSFTSWRRRTWHDEGRCHRRT
jgi:hypothetical protein